LPLEVLEKLRQQVISKLECEDLEQLASQPRIFLIDGTAVSMPDEEELQKEFPQPGRQRKGCARIKSMGACS